MSTAWIPRRKLKRLAAWTLPEFVKRHLRGPLYGYRKARLSLPVAFPHDEAGAVILIDRRIRLRFSEADRPAIATHFTDHGAAVEEMASFIGASGTAATFFDVGADRGMFSVVFCAMGNGRRAVAFEPSAQRYTGAIALAALNGFDTRLTLRQAAVGASRQRATGTLFADGTTVPDSHDPSGEPVDMEMTTVDSEVAALGMVPDVMKIDVEGYEYEVLRGAGRLLRDRRPTLCLELHLDLMERRGISLAEVVAHLQSYDYRFRSCLGRPLDPSDIVDSTHAILRVVAF